jgi:ATP-binding cassette, subfamily F, member 3
MLVVSGISKRFRGAETPILRDVSFTVNAGERVALIGPNGSGKSTLLRIITGEDTSDRGSVTFSPPDLRAGYLPQGMTVADELPLGEVLDPRGRALRVAEADVARLAETLAAGEDAAAAYDAALDRLLRLSATVDDGLRARVLAELGLAGIPLDTPVGTLSGGQKTRLNLAAILLDAPQLLILDEPTNHLDVVALEWLEDWLLNFPGGLLVVSHDRTFLDRITTRTVALDPETATARVHAGSYSDYALTVRRERDKQWAQWRDQQVEIARMQADIRTTMDRAQRKERATKNDQQRRYAKKVAKRAKSKETRLRHYLESDERVDKPSLHWDVKMEFEGVGHIRAEALRLENLSIGYDPAAPLLAGLDLSVRAGERVVIMGPNGHGKTTLLRTITGQLAPLAGGVRVASSAGMAYLAQEQEVLDPRASALTTIQAEARLSETEARSFLHFFLFSGDDPLRPIADLSYGERSRLMLARLVARGANLLLLDEPLNHLDLPSREKFEAALENFPGSVLAVVHDRYFVERLATTVWHLEDGVLDVELCAVEAG